jgi:hypothetical protein
MALIERESAIYAKYSNGFTCRLDHHNGHWRPPWLSWMGADIDAKDNDDMTALHWTCLNGHTETAMALIDRGG